MYECNDACKQRRKMQHYKKNASMERNGEYTVCVSPCWYHNISPNIQTGGENKKKRKRDTKNK